MEMIADLLQVTVINFYWMKDKFYFGKKGIKDYE